MSIREDEIQTDLSSRSTSSPIQGNINTSITNCNRFTAPANSATSMNMLADTVMILKNSVKELQGEIAAIRDTKTSSSNVNNNSWNEMQSFLNDSRINTQANPKVSSSQVLTTIGSGTTLQPGILPAGATTSRAVLDPSPPVTHQESAGMQFQPLTVQTLREQEVVRRQAEFQYQQLQNECKIGQYNSGESNTLFKRVVKSGRERTGGDDFRRVYVKWPQEACFVGADRKRVKYDDLSYPQWTAGITTVAATESDPIIQKNMLKYIAALQQDVCDFGFDTARGAHALILTNIEESHCSWLDIELIQGMRQSYTYKIQAKSTGQTMGTSDSNHKSGADRPTRICRNFNTGSCTHSSSHVSANTQFNHYCAHCYKQGYKYSHAETECKRKPSGRVSNSASSSSDLNVKG